MLPHRPAACRSTISRLTLIGFRLKISKICRWFIPSIEPTGRRSARPQGPIIQASERTKPPAACWPGGLAYTNGPRL